MPDYTGPIPIPTPESRPFWDAARRHELQLPCCRACGQYHYYPRASCPHCLSGDLQWRRLSGRGRVHTFTVIHRGVKGFPLPAPYVMAVVELDEGPRMLTNLLDVPADPARIPFGMRVEVTFTDVTPEIALPHFRPVGAST